MSPASSGLLLTDLTPEMASNCLSSALSLVNLTGSGQVRDSRGWTVLHLAARHSKPQTVRLVIQQGGRVGERDEAGNTPLHLACEAGNKEAARVLVHHGASLTDRNTAGLAPLHVAAKNGHGGVLEILVQNLGNNNIDMVTTIGSRTALHIAARYEALISQCRVKVLPRPDT